MYRYISRFKYLAIYLILGFMSLSLVAQQQVTGLVVTGSVSDAATGLPLPGVNVTVENFSSAITSDSGYFSIKIPAQNATLIVSGTGFQNKEVPIKGRTNVKIQLYEAEYNSVYDNAYMPNGHKPLNKVANSVVSLNTNQKWQYSSTTPENYFEGKISGMNTIPRSGVQGIGANMYLHGLSSLHATNQPLFVVDGMIYDMNDYGGSLIGNYFTNPLQDIDIKDIDNFTVIKDAASIYGSKASNGVVLIRTAHAPEQSTRIDFSINGGFNTTPKELPLLNSSDYRIYLSDILKSRGYSDSYIQSLPYMIDDNTNSDYYIYHNSTNWQKEVFKNSYNSDYYLKVTGGDEIATYALSMGYLKNDGIINGTDFSRYHMRFNTDIHMSEKFTVNANISFSYNEHNLKDEGLFSKTNPIYLALTKAPFLSKNEIGGEGKVSPNLADLDIFNVGNPAAIISNMKENAKNYRFFGSANFNYEITKKLNVSSLVGITHDKIRENVFIPRNGILSDTLNNAIAESRMESGLQRLFSLYNDTKLAYNNTFSRIHNVSAIVGMRYSSNQSTGNYGLGYNSPIDQLRTIGTGVSSLRKTGGEIGEWNTLSYYGSLDYQLMNKYFLTFNISADGSSRFGTKINNALTLFNHKFGVFPSIAGAWLVSSENFMSSLNFIEQLKLRLSYGVTGNDDIGDYNAKELYTSQNLLGDEGLVRSTIGNPALQWETKKKLNAGIDLALFEERLTISVDLYKDKISNLLTYDPLLPYTGFSYMITNSGSMENKGIDVSLNARLINKSSFKWDMGMIFSMYRNKLTKLPNDNEITNYGAGQVISRVGRPLGLFYGYKTNGVYSSTDQATAEGLQNELTGGTLVPFTGGDVRFVDQNGDKTINADDQKVIGNPNPLSTGMFSSRFQYKRISLEADFTFSYGNDVYNYMRYVNESMSGYANQSPAVMNRWRAEGQVTNMPKAEWGDPMGNSRFSDRWIEDGSYLRLKTLTLSYNLPIKPGFFKSAMVYLTGNNLLTFTKYLGYDPEFSSSESAILQGIDVGLTPQFKSVLFGLKVGL